MAKQFDYQLRQDLSIEQIISFVTKLRNNHRLINKGFLKLGTYPDIPQLHFEVSYEKEKQNLEGNIVPHVLLNLLIEVQVFVVKESKKKGCPFLLPTDNNSKEFRAFYFQDEYDDAQNTTKENVQKELIAVFYDVVTGSLQGDKTSEDSAIKPVSISELSYSLRQGDLIERWQTDSVRSEVYVSEWVDHLIALPVGELLVPGLKSFKDENYSFENALGALDEYHKKFKDYLPLFSNYGHPSGSSEKQAIDRLERSSTPFFGGRSALEQTVISSDQLTGKLSTDNSKLEEYKDIFTKAIAALKKETPKVSSAGGSDDIDGGESETEEKREEQKDQKKIIDFDQLNNIVRGRLVSFVYAEFYKTAVDATDENQKYEIRKIILAIISDKIDRRINLRVILRNRLNNEWSGQIEEEKIYNDETLSGLIEELLQYLAEELGVADEINQDINVALNNLQGLQQTKQKTELPGIDTTQTSVIVIAFMKEKLPEEDHIFETRSDLIRNWQKLTFQERYEFLKEHGFLAHLDAYAEFVAQEFLSDELAKYNLIGTKDSQFNFLLENIEGNIREDLVDFPPTEYGDDPQVFIEKLRREADFLRIEQRWAVEFVPSLERELSDFALHNPQFVRIDLSGVNTVEEAAIQVNPAFTDTTEVERIVNSASEAILDRIMIDLGLPGDVRLVGIDRQYAIDSIELQLREFLLANPDALPYLFTENQLLLFINKYGSKFIDRRGAYFLPVVEEVVYEAHRQQVLSEIQQKVGGDAQYREKVDETLHYILAQATLSEIDPEKYIQSLNDEELLALFSVETQFKDDDQQQKFALEFKALIIEYFQASEKALHLDEIIDKNKDVDKEEFTDDLLFLRRQGRAISPQRGGRVMYSAFTQEGPDPDELADLEDEAEYLDYEERALKGYQRQRLLALAIWEAYTEEERRILEEQNAQNMAAYEWERILESQAKESGQTRSKQKKRNPIKEMAKKATDKAVTEGAAAASGAIAGLIVPGAGAAVTSFIKALPIPEKYKKYLAIGILGGIVSFVGATVYLFTHTMGGFIGGILGGIGGFFVGGPAGIIPGFTAGTWTGYGIQKAIEGGGSTSSSLASNTANLSRSGSIVPGGSGSSAAGGGSIIPGGGGSSAGGGGSATFGSAVTTVQSTMTTTAAQAVVATVGTGFVGGIIISEGLHSSYLQRPPELVGYGEDASSKYVQIEKSASPSQMENGETSDISYSITITPQEEYVITVNQASDEISILGTNSGGTNFEIDQSQITEQLQPNTEISSPITVQYTLPGVSGTDIAINNQFTLDFFVEDNGTIVEESVTDSAVVTIGDPELGCFQFADAGEPTGRGPSSIAWSNSDQSKIVNAYSRVLNNTTFMGLICSDGPITFYRLAGSEYGGWALSANSVGIYDLGVTSQNSATYTTIHELGHLMDYRNPGLRNRFQAIWGGSCFTYPYNCYAGEPFAEAVALYEIHDFYMFRNSSGGRSLYDFPGLHPTEYAWVEDNIYGGGN